ncbi:MAG TPA: hypothetical protein PKD79_01780 [Candidatus Doudnabacteria bacterium]|nr:hypothetical protein [Candidatus Doudnabacteria bacterium]
MTQAAKSETDTSIWRTLTVTEVTKYSSSIDFRVEESTLVFAMENSQVKEYGISEIKPGDQISVRGKYGNSDDNLWGMNVIADMKMLKRA